MGSKIQFQLDEYGISGIKNIGLYDYYLLIDGLGSCYIERVAEDDSTMLFAKMPEVNVNHLADVAAAIDAFWEHPETHSYKYAFQC